MNLLIDSGVWWANYHRLPMRKDLEALMADGANHFFLCPLSVMEMLFKWRHRPKLLPAPDPQEWLEDSLKGYTPAFVNLEASRLAGLWDWPHGDPIDRALCAVAKVRDLTLIHTDTRLKDLRGFPQRYFPKVSENPSA